MNKIDTTQVTDPTSLQPFTTKSLAFLQDAYQQAMQGLARCLAGELNWTQITVPGGIALGGVYPSGNNLTEGFIIASETGTIEEAEIFYYAGQSNVLTYPTPVFDLLETNDGVADPVEFSDGVSKNVHKVRRLTVLNQASGSGMFDYADLINLKTYGGIALTYGTGWSTYTTAVEYRLTPENVVQLKGAAQRTWSGTDLTIGTLPANYRPLVEKHLTAQVYNSTTAGWTACDITVTTGGVIAFGQHGALTPGDNIRVFLDGLSFYTQW